jgi:hypothetical protein
MYEIEGWEYNEGSGSSDWLTEAMNTGSNVANYLPEGYANPTWDKPEHYSYEPGTNYGEPTNTESDDVLSFGTGGGGGGYTVGSQWGQGANTPSGSPSMVGTGARTITGTGGGNSGQWFNTLVTQVMQATKDLPTYTAPTWDKSRIKALTQKNFGTAANQLGNKVSEAITRSQSMDNPLLQKEYMRGTLRGYGEGLGFAQQSAGQKALTEYVPEHQADVDAAKTIFDAAMKDYLATMKAVTTRDYERFTY